MEPVGVMPRAITGAQRASVLLGLLTAAFGLTVLCGWFFNLPALTEVIPGQVSMKANSAAAFLLLGLALAAAAQRRLGPLVQTVAAAVLLLALLTLLEYALGLDLLIDEVLVHEHPDATGTSHPGRMSPLTALGFVFAAAALLVVTRRPAQAQWLAIATLLLTLFSLAGYAYGVEQLSGLTFYTRMALHTTLTFALLGAGTLLLRPQAGPIAALRWRSLGGLLVRQLLPAVIATLLLIGLGASLLISLQLADPRTALAFVVILGITLAAGLVYRFAGLLHMAEQQRRAAQSALRRQHEWLHTTLASIGDAVITTDVEGRVSSVNPVAERLTGWSDAQSRGRPLDEVFRIIDEASKEPAPNPALRVLHEGYIGGLSKHTVLLHRDGRQTPIDESAAPIRREDGTLMGSVLVFRDVTARRAAERAVQDSEARKAAIIGAALDAIVTMDGEGLIVEFNPAAEQILGHRSADVIGQPLADLIIPERLRDAHSQGLDRHLASGESRVLGQRLELPALHAKGHEFPAELSIVRHAPHGRVLFTGYLRDITDRRQAEARLRASEARFRMLADVVPQLVGIADAQGRLTYLNEHWQTYTGMPSDPRQAGRFREVVHPDDRERYFGELAGAIREQRNFAIEVRFRSRHGEYRWFVVRASRAGEAEDATWYGTATDIHETKTAEHRARFLATASAELTDLTDARSTLQRVAASAVPEFADWCTIHLLPEDGALERAELMAVSHRDTAWRRALLTLRERWPISAGDPHGAGRVMASGESELLRVVDEPTLEAMTPDAGLRRALRAIGLESQITVPVASHGRLLGAITFASGDAGKRYGEADLEMALNLASRAAIALDNAQLYAALREADRRKDEFLATLAHELRNPLAPIRTGLEVLRLADDDAAKRQTAYGVMERQVQQLVALIDDLLDVSRITRGKLELRSQAVELREVVDDAVAASRPVIDERGHTLKVNFPEADIALRADPHRLAQILSNLLNNAAKYTPNGGYIVLEVSREEDGVRMAVQDNGIGIPAEERQRIFEMFAQLGQPLKGGEAGLGIGLTLVKSLIELHGGRIDVHSEGRNRGSTFGVWLPLAPPPKPAAPQADEAPAQPIAGAAPHPRCAGQVRAAGVLRQRGRGYRSDPAGLSTSARPLASKRLIASGSAGLTRWASKPASRLRRLSSG